MDYSDKIFEMLDVKPFETFYLRDSSGDILKNDILKFKTVSDRYLPYYLTKTLKLCCMPISGFSFVSESRTIRDILSGAFEIVKIPFCNQISDEE